MQNLKTKTIPSKTLTCKDVIVEWYDGKPLFFTPFCIEWKERYYTTEPFIHVLTHSRLTRRTISRWYSLLNDVVEVVA